MKYKNIKGKFIDTKKQGKLGGDNSVQEQLRVNSISKTGNEYAA